MWEPKVSGWQASWGQSDAVLADHVDRLSALVGARLVGAWTVWIEREDDWFADMPVVLQFDDGSQLEVCWQRLDDLSLSWNTIDLGKKPEAWISDLDWRNWAHLALSMNRDETVTAVGGTQFVWSTTDVDHPHVKESRGLLTGGLWIGTTGSGLHVFNALDENGLAPNYDGDRLKLIAQST